jgi:predicted RNase H-like HicB family nuclease
MSVPSKFSLTNDNLVSNSVPVINFTFGGLVMRYSVLIEAINEPEFEGYYYAHVPTLDLTTHGEGIEGAIAAARELIEAWVEEKRSRGEKIPVESKSLITQIEIADAVLRP